MDYTVLFSPSQSLPWPSSSEPHAAGAQAAEELPDCTHNLPQQRRGHAEKSPACQWAARPCVPNEGHIYSREGHGVCYVMHTKVGFQFRTTVNQ